MSIQQQERFELSTRRVSWDEAMSLLGAIWDAPCARATMAVDGLPILTTDWASLESIDAVDDSVTLRVAGLDVLITAGRCDHIAAESWDHGLCRALVFALGDTVLSVQASWWQHR